MAETKRITGDRLFEYFERFTKRFLADDAPETVDVEVLDPELGDQHVVHGSRLMGVTYDPRANALELQLESGTHRTYSPSEVWALEEPDGFVSQFAVVRQDGGREIVTVKKVGLRET